MVFEDNCSRLETIVPYIRRMTGTYRIREDKIGKDEVRVTRLQKVVIEIEDGKTVFKNFDKTFNADVELDKKKQVEEIFKNFLGDIPIVIKSNGTDKYYRFGKHTFSVRFCEDKKGNLYAEINTVYKG